MTPVIVTFQPEGTKIKARPGESILDILSYAGLDINNQCGGEGVCGKCRVKVTRGRVNFSSKTLASLPKTSWRRVSSSPARRRFSLKTSRSGSLPNRVRKICRS